MTPMMECYMCGRKIEPGDLYVSVNYQQERTEGFTVEVVEAQSLLTACFECAPSKDELIRLFHPYYPEAP